MLHRLKGRQTARSIHITPTEQTLVSSTNMRLMTRLMINMAKLPVHPPNGHP